MELKCHIGLCSQFQFREGHVQSDISEMKGLCPGSYNQTPSLSIVMEFPINIKLTLGLLQFIISCSLSSLARKIMKAAFPSSRQGLRHCCLPRCISSPSWQENNSKSEFCFQCLCQRGLLRDIVTK